PEQTRPPGQDAPGERGRRRSGDARGPIAKESFKRLCTQTRQKGRILYYNADHLNESGVAGPPSDPASFIDATRKVMRYDGDQVVRWGTRAPSFMEMFFGYVWQNGGNYFSDDAFTQVSLTSPEVQRALEFAYDMVFTH